MWEDEPGTTERWEDAQSILFDQVEQAKDPSRTPRNPSGHHEEVSPSEVQLEAASALLIEARLAPSPASVHRLAVAIHAAALDLCEAMLRRTGGDWSPDTATQRFPSMLPGASSGGKAAAAKTSLSDLLAGFARDKGWPVEEPGKPILRALYDRKMTLARLEAFLGHNDAGQVTKGDAVRWKEEMQSRVKPLSPLTIRNDLSEMSAIWKWGIHNEKVPGPNPFDGISPPKPKRSQKGKRRPFTDAEAVAILTAARGQTGYMRWLPWVCCLTGSRVSEICQAYREDIFQVGAVWAIKLHDEGADDEEGVRSMKNEDSRRTLPLHPALISEGFLAYVQALPAKSPLFPDAAPDGLFGKRSTNAGKKMSRWLKQSLKITDPRISPNHSWRHWFTDACRAVEMGYEVRSALTGHSAKMDESAHYGAGVGAFVNLLAEALSRVRCPVPPLGG